MSFIDNQAELFATFSESVQKKLIKLALASYQSSDMVYINRILQADIKKQILVDLGMASAVDSLIDDYDRVVAGLSKSILGKIPHGTIEMLKELDTQFWFEHVGDIGDEVKRTLIHASIGGVTEGQLQAQLFNATKELSKAQINTLTNTSLRTMSRATFAAGANELPDTAGFIFDGPIDSKNRDTCAEVLANPQNQTGFTIAEINGLPVDFVGGGGFNCRHSWIRAIEE